MKLLTGMKAAVVAIVCALATSLSAADYELVIEDGVLTGYTGTIQGACSIPSTVTSIGDSAFQDCSELTSVAILNSVTNIGNYAFSRCSNLKTVTIPRGVKRIAEYTFQDCAELKSVVLPSTITEIGEAAFAGCTSLPSISLSEGVKDIGASAFCGCSEIESFKIPNSVTNIGEQAFANCSQLQTINIPDAVVHVGWGAFDGTEVLSRSENTWYYSKNELKGVYVVDDWAVGCASGYLSDYLPSELNLKSVRGIADEAFYGTSLTSVVIPASVVTIGARAFSYCGYLTSVEIANGVKTIGDEAFWECAPWICRRSGIRLR